MGISINSLTKIYSLGTLRFGWIIASPEIAEQARRAFITLGGMMGSPILRIADSIFPHLDIVLDKVEHYRKKNLPMLVFYHGGGFVIGSLESQDTVCRSLCVEAQCIVVAVEYRLAPENKYPAALEDAWSATEWVAGNANLLGGDPARLAIGGDSAGGCLAATVALMAKESGGPNISKQLLIYPCTDMTRRYESHKTFGEGYRLTSDLIEWFYNHYFSEEDDVESWKASPLNSTKLEGLPPTFVISAGFDPLQDEAEAYADKLMRAGVSTKHSHYEGMLHGFITMPGVMDKAKEALTECAQELKLVFQR